jgi:hypothetical protein
MTETDNVVATSFSDRWRRRNVPDHKEVAKGTLRAIIRQSGLTVDEFNTLL